MRARSRHSPITLPRQNNVVVSTWQAPRETWARLPSEVSEAAPSLLVVSHDPGSIRLFQRHLPRCRVIASEPIARISDPPGVRAIVHIFDQHDDLNAILRETAGLNPHTPVLLCRVPSERYLREDLHVSYYLVKPFAREHFLAAVSRIPSPTHTILVVADDPTMVELIARSLPSHHSNFSVVRAYRGAEALAILQQTDCVVDRMILDLIMPELDGLAVLDAFHATACLASLPIIVVSARGFIDRRVASSVLAVTRGQGLSIRDLMALTERFIQAFDAHNDRSDRPE